MDIQLAKRVQGLKPSPTLAVTARAKELKAEGKDIIGLGAGEPDFDTPDPIKEAAIQAIHDGFTKYTAVDGTPELKQAIIDKFARDNGLHYEPDQVLVSCGGKHSFYNLAQAYLGPGDEAIIPAPYWVSYPPMVELAGAAPVIVDGTMANGFKVTPEQLATTITPNTRMLLINSPSNPTGVVYGRDELAALGEVIRRHPQLLVVTDDIYESIVWGAETCLNILTVCPDLYERTVVLNGVSKTYSMTGWRIGYAAGPAKLIKAMKSIQSQSTSNPASISQAAATAALTGDQSFITRMIGTFKERHDVVIERLNAMAGVECLPAQGAFYLFPSFQGVIDRLDGIADDVALAEHLLEQAGVALVPGSAFGAPGHMRLSFATSMDNLVAAMDRLDAALGSRP